MSTQTLNRIYETRRASTEKPTLKSRVDWKRTKRDIVQVLTSEEEDFSSSEDQLQDHGDGDVNVDSSSTDDEEEQEPRKVFLEKEDAEDDYIPTAKRKRVSSILYDQDSSSDEEEPVRKVVSKRHCVMDDESTDGESEENCSLIVSDTSVILLSEGELAKSRKQNRQAKLKELSEKLLKTLKSNSRGHSETEEDFFPIHSTPTETSEQEEDDRGSLSSFIVDDEGEQDGESENETQSQACHSLFLHHNIPLASDHFVHFQRIVKAFLINAVDDTFLTSLFDGTRQKRYAKEMVASLNHLDERIIAPRLENLMSRSRWRTQYKERVESYPFVQINQCRSAETVCQACGLTRWVSLEVLLSGEMYNNKTLETDDFMQNDRQTLKVGTICAERTRVYHQLKHFKYKLHRRCVTIAECAQNDDMAVKETVERLFTKLKTSWLQTEYDILEKYLNEADYFQEEMI